MAQTESRATIDRGSEPRNLPSGLDLTRLPPEVVKAITRPHQTMATPEKREIMVHGKGHSSLPDMAYHGQAPLRDRSKDRSRSRSKSREFMKKDDLKRGLYEVPKIVDADQDHSYIQSEV